MKTVIHVWTHEFNINQEHLLKYNYLKETNFYFGIGDLLRSTIQLYHLSKVMNFHFIVDIQLHPISQFLQVFKHEYSDYVLRNKDNVDYVCYGAVEDYINEHSQEEILLLLTNDFYSKDDIDNDCKDFIKKIFTPTKLFRTFINNKISRIPFKKFNIFHYRINDNEFLNNHEEILYETYFNHFKKNKEENDILISDTKKLKKYIFMHDNIFMFDTKVCHLGLSKVSDEIRDTLFEFFLLTYATKIKTYCKIHNMSGFIKWISKVYDIPVVSFNY
jgi:hypothetical protein